MASAVAAVACLLVLLSGASAARGCVSSTAQLLPTGGASASHRSVSTTAHQVPTGSASASHRNVTTTSQLPTGGALPLWVQRLLALGSSSAPTLGSMEGKRFVVAPGASGGHGHFSSISADLAAAAAQDALGMKKKGGRYMIFIKEGVYRETLRITTKHVILIGEGVGKTVITGNKSVAFDRLSTQDTATVGVHGRGFMAQDLSISNTAGPAGKQAVALMSRSHYSLVYRCSIQGYQDTLDADTGLQMYLESSIHGTVDFVFGYARAAFLGCCLLVRNSGTGAHNVVPGGQVRLRLPQQLRHRGRRRRSDRGGDLPGASVEGAPSWTPSSTPRAGWSGTGAMSRSRPPCCTWSTATLDSAPTQARV